MNDIDEDIKALRSIVADAKLVGAKARLADRLLTRMAECWKELQRLDADLLYLANNPNPDEFCTIRDIMFDTIEQTPRW